MVGTICDESLDIIDDPDDDIDVEGVATII